MRYQRISLLIAFVGAILLASCSSSTESANPNAKTKVVATTGMVADLARNIGGDSIEVEALMGPGVDPHLYKATQGDLSTLRGADIILYNGLHLEGKMGEIFEKLSRIKKIAAVAESVPESKLISDPNFQGARDPHIWFDVSLWLQTVDQVTQTLSEVNPENKVYYQNNATAYKQTLEKLHEWARQEILKIDESQRVMITAHDAFSYFGRAYGIEVRGLQGLSTQSEFGLKDRVDLVDFIVEKDIKAIFVETSVSEKNIKAIIESCNEKGHQVKIGGSLYSDAMGAFGTETGTYEGMVRANVNTIVSSLQQKENEE